MSFEVREAPTAPDIIWANLAMEYWQRYTRTIIVNIAIGWLILFW